ncbi:MAG: 50S ribosomal protein L9 [bacterium]|jgi:large subunit ribosomal protein L9|nr:50S ribosomal protein L9 [bacterium]MBK7190538.1 50S ribosomal protein L9 [bacterium]MBK7670819.1 50S ribosomal protein L9 [bacterium]MBK7770932.1 50S ribosomal protein L9 [bacterium]MBK9472963.1 50S ribosomal protein L9 [bacterium]
MEIILMHNVENLGRMGDTVSVKRGFARNYLIPKGLAVVSSEAHRKLVAAHLKQEAKREDQRLGEARVLAAKIGTLSCTLAVQADEENKLFGSVTARDIAAVLHSDHATIEHKQVLLEEPLKMLGEYDVEVKIYGDVRVIAKVNVVRS